MALIDLTNKKFGRLTVLERDISKPKGHGKPVYWICQCDCGNIKSVKSCHLKDGSIQSCGCLHKERVSKQFSKDISNKKYDYLTAIRPLYINEHGNGQLCKICDFPLRMRLRIRTAVLPTDRTVVLISLRVPFPRQPKPKAA
jgi:hypothetical protein